MATESEISSASGPFHLTSINWNNSQHRTLVTSCLVNGVYTMELDRQKNRVGPESEAKSWWESFHFTLLETLIDESDNSIYGAIFEYNHFGHYYGHRKITSLGVYPRYVIAFRGTILNSQTWFRDVVLDLRCVFDNLHNGTRFVHAMQAIHALVAKHSETSVWLTGHSLGAGLALLAGKTMSRSGFFLETYIFNPPISSIPLEKLTNIKMLKDGARIAGSFFKAGVARTFKDLKVQQDDVAMMNTAPWIPYLYVNAGDPICSEYIGYFKHKTLMSKIGWSKIERIATENPFRSLLVGKEGKSSLSYLSTDPLHLLSSAYMTVNKSGSFDCNIAHGLQQWWDPSFSGEYVSYQFDCMT